MGFLLGYVPSHLAQAPMLCGVPLEGKGLRGVSTYSEMSNVPLSFFPSLITAYRLTPPLPWVD